MTRNCDEGNGRDWKESVVCHNKVWFNGGHNLVSICFFIWCNSPQWARASSFTSFLYHTQGRITLGRIPLDDWSARRRDLYLTTHNTHSRQTCTRWIRTYNLIRQAAADPRLSPRGHWGRLLVPIEHIKQHAFFFCRTQKLDSLIQTSLHVSGDDDCYRMMVDIHRNT
jgi:hypothetical protein